MSGARGGATPRPGSLLVYTGTGGRFGVACVWADTGEGIWHMRGLTRKRAGELVTNWRAAYDCPVKRSVRVQLVRWALPSSDPAVTPERDDA